MKSFNQYYIGLFRQMNIKRCINWGSFVCWVACQKIESKLKYFEACGNVVDVLAKRKKALEAHKRYFFGKIFKLWPCMSGY